MKIKNNKNFIIAIDGTAGSGKGTIAKLLAQYYSLNYLDTGLTYRAVAYNLLQNNLAIDNVHNILNCANSIDFNNLNSELLSKSEIADIASKIAIHPELRQFLVEKQRHFAYNADKGYKGTILDGRDIGSVVCPNANIKFYVDAKAEIRAQRRFKQLKNLNPDDKTSSYEQILQQIIKRDARDKNRPQGALYQAKDAILIDTSNLSIKQAVDLAKKHIDSLIKN